MRPTVVTRESDLFWRRTDDEHPRCDYALTGFVVRLSDVGIMYCAGTLTKAVLPAHFQA